MGPPVGERLRYAVYAAADRKRWSPPTTCELEILPPVADVVMDVERDVARCTWRAHPEARVLVRRGEGAPPRGPQDGALVEISGSGFPDPPPPPGIGHRSSLTAGFPDKPGQGLRAE